MKKTLIPVLSLAFIISLDSCKKDSDNQPEQQEVGDTTRVVKTSYTHSTSSTIETMYYEYDKSGRIISQKDSADPTYYVTISYVGDEAIFEEAPATPGNFNYSARYKLNSNRLPVQRITAENMDGMSTSNPSFQIHADTCKFEYDAAGLLVKGTGTHYDTTWSHYSGSSINYSSNREAYSISYTNTNGKLMAVKITGTEVSSNTQVGGNSYTNTYNNEENYSFEYTKNYANKADSINAWVFAELGMLYGTKWPTIKYANLPDKTNHSTKRTNVVTGYESTYTEKPLSMELDYLPSGYISAVTFSDGTYWDKTRFTYNK
jgi:YD repeat-containing protein